MLNFRYFVHHSDYCTGIAHADIEKTTQYLEDAPLQVNAVLVFLLNTHPTDIASFFFSSDYRQPHHPSLAPR
jgi:hypothetical protein